MGELGQKSDNMQLLEQMTFIGQMLSAWKDGGPLETRTPDPLIKSQLLYQLS